MQGLRVGNDAKGGGLRIGSFEQSGPKKLSKWWVFWSATLPIMGDWDIYVDLSGPDWPDSGSNLGLNADKDRFRRLQEGNGMNFVLELVGFSEP